MELGMREWMLLIGALLILLVLADGVRRVIQDRRSNMRMKVASKDPIDDYLSELPNGGARVISGDKGPQQEAVSPLSFQSDSLTLDSKRKKALASTIEQDLADDFVFNPVEDERVESQVDVNEEANKPTIEQEPSASEPIAAAEPESDLVPELLSSPAQTMQDAVESFAVSDDAISANTGRHADAIFDQMLAQVEQDVRDTLVEDTGELTTSEQQDVLVDGAADDLPSLTDLDLDFSAVSNDNDDVTDEDAEPSVVLKAETPVIEQVIEDEQPAPVDVTVEVEAETVATEDASHDTEQPELDVDQSQVTAETLFDHLSLSNQPGKDVIEPVKPKKYRSNPFDVPEQQSFDLGDGSVPMLIDSVAKDEDDVVDLADLNGFVPRKTPKKSVRKVVQTPVVDSAPVDSALETTAKPIDETSGPIDNDEVVTARSVDDVDGISDVANLDVEAVKKAGEVRSPDVKSPPVTKAKSANKTLLDRLADIPVFGKPQAAIEQPTDEVVVKEGFEEPSVADYQHIQIINVRSKDSAGFDADKLHSFFKACDIQLNRHKVYQRNEEANGRGAIEFNIANQVQSGIFMAEDGGELIIPGVSFYLGLPGPADPLAALEAMIQTAEYLASHFDGVMKDKEGSDINKQVLDYFRQDIKEFSRKHLAESS